MKVIVESAKVHERAGQSQRTGKDYRIREQRALLKGERVAGEISLVLEDDQGPYQPGEYEIDIERSVYIGRFSRPELRLKLKAAQAAGRLSAAA